MKVRTPALLQANERTERLILDALVARGPLTFHQIGKLALPNVSFREVDARVRWLREHDQVETRVPPGEKKARWHITAAGRARVADPARTAFDSPAAESTTTAQVTLP